MSFRFSVAVPLVLLLACGGEQAAVPPPPSLAAGRTFTVADTIIAATLEVATTAEPLQHAVLGTRLMGAVTSVLVHEGDRVRAGQALVRIDARDVTAKQAQVDAGIGAAEAMQRDAETQAGRFRSLYADSAATRYQLEQAETGLARANAALETARGARQELDAVGAYAVVRAPFDGVVTRRLVDPGAFVAPGAPIVEVQDQSRLRASGMVAPAAAAGLRPGMPLTATIEGRPARATVEGVVPAGAGALYVVNAIIDNRKGEFPAGGAATLLVPSGTRIAMLIPTRAIVQQGDLTGVRVKTAAGSELRWVQAVGQADSAAPVVEVLAGLRAGDVVLLGSD